MNKLDLHVGKIPECNIEPLAFLRSLTSRVLIKGSNPQTEKVVNFLSLSNKLQFAHKFLTVSIIKAQIKAERVWCFFQSCVLAGPLKLHYTYFIMGAEISVGNTY